MFFFLIPYFFQSICSFETKLWLFCCSSCAFFFLLQYLLLLLNCCFIYLLKVTLFCCRDRLCFKICSFFLTWALQFPDDSNFSHSNFETQVHLPSNFFFLKPQAKGRCAKVKKKKKQNIYSKPKMSSIFYMCRKGKKGGFVKSSLFLGGGLLELIRKVERKSVFKGPSDFFLSEICSYCW